MSAVIDSLLTFSLFLLKPGGRLVFFLPTNSAEYADVDIPSIPGLKLISNSSQDFGKWARRLITMEKLPAGSGWEEVVEGLDRGVEREGMQGLEERLARLAMEGEGEGEAAEERRKKPGHAEFRRWYFEQNEKKVERKEEAGENKKRWEEGRRKEEGAEKGEEKEV